MKKITKWIGIVLLLLVVAGVVGFFALSSKGKSKLEETYNIEVTALNLPTDSVAMTRGFHLVDIICKECHGENMAGKMMMQDEGFATLYAPNLTAGDGGIGQVYTVLDWQKAIRHGIHPNGKSLFLMPSLSFSHLSDYDLGAIIAFLRTLPAVDGQVPERKFMGVANVLLGIGAFDGDLQASLIDHKNQEVPSINTDNPLANGKYLTAIAGCNHCHAANFAGAKIGDPKGPPSPNITTGGALGNWSEAEFVTVMRSGKTPEGLELQPQFMPYPSFAKLTNDELHDIFSYIKSLPAKPDNAL